MYNWNSRRENRHKQILEEITDKDLQNCLQTQNQIAKNTSWKNTTQTKKKTEQNQTKVKNKQKPKLQTKQ